MTKKTALTPEEINSIKKNFASLSSILDSALEAIEEEQEGDLFAFKKHEPSAEKITGITERAMTVMGNTFNELKGLAFTENKGE